MKKLIVIAAALCACVVVATAQFAGWLVSSKKAATGTPSCVLWQIQSSQNDISYGSIVSQSISNSTAVTVCKVSILLQDIGSSTDVYVQLRSAANGGGTQYGTDSQTVTVGAGSGQVWRDFTWSSNPTVGTGTFWINLRKSGSDSAYVRNYDDLGIIPNQYFTNLYHLNVDGTDLTARDMAFEVHTQ